MGRGLWFIQLYTVHICISGSAIAYSFSFNSFFNRLSTATRYSVVVT